MTSGYDTVSFFSDYGAGAESIGLVKSVVRTLAPSAVVVDINHDIPAFDVRAGALALIRSATHLVPGVVMAVVDARSASPIAVEVGDGESVLVGPDNGLLAPVVAMVGGATKAVTLSVDWESQPALGRDVFATAAARLCVGARLEDLGTEVDPSELRPSMLPFSTEKDGVFEGDVLWIDRFGNVELNLSADQLKDLPKSVQITANGRSFSAQSVTDIRELKAGKTGLLVDANGMASLMLAKASAAERHQLSEQDSVTVGPLEV